MPNPDDARPIRGAVAVLRELAAGFAKVAIVSGRSVEFLVEQLGLDEEPFPIELYGQYGLEHRDADGSATGPSAKDRYIKAVDAALAEAHERVQPGVIVEAKGMALTLHWRRAPGAKNASVALARSLAERHGLHLREGKMTAELVPDAAQNKGNAIRSLFADLSAGCVLGDDFGDIPAFRAARELGRQRRFDVLLVAVASADVPPELIELSDLRVEGPSGALSFLEALASAVA